MNPIRIAFVALCAVLLAAPAPVRAEDDAIANIDAQINQLTSLQKSLEIQAKALGVSTKGNVKTPAYPKSLKKNATKIRRQLNAVEQQISTLQAQKKTMQESAAADELVLPELEERLKEIAGPAPVDPIVAEIIAPADDEDGDEDDAEDGDEDDDEDDDEDEEETDPHRKWLEEFVDGKLEGVSDLEWSHALYNAYFEAYGILQADPTCPPDLLAEVADLCERFKAALDVENEMSQEDEGVGDDPGAGEEDSPEVDEDSEDDDSGDEDETPEEDSEALEEESGEGSWNGPYIDDPIPDFGGAGGSSGEGSGKTEGGDADDRSSSSASNGVSRSSFWSGSGSSGGTPSSTGQLYGRNSSSGSSGAGASYPTAGSYLGFGATGDASVATNYVDDIPYDLLKWKFGGFKPSSKAVRSSVTISGLRVNKGGLRLKWVRNLGAWGIPYEVPDGIACLFVKTSDGEWVGGKFEWISSSRETREFTNIREGYNGWNLRNVPNPCEVAFLVFRKDGKRRSNVISGLWQR